MTSANEAEGLTAALLQLAALTEKLASLEHRQATDASQARDHVTALAKAIDQATATIAGQSRAIAALDGLGTQVRDLAARLDSLAPPGSHLAACQPSAVPRLWEPDGPAVDQAVARLRAWVEQVYRPGYGYLSAGLAGCWDQHPLCLYTLDWLSELWSVLYLAPDRTQGTLAGQAEWHTRLLPAAADQMTRETRSCRHGADRWHSAARTGTRP